MKRLGLIAVIMVLCLSITTGCGGSSGSMDIPDTGGLNNVVAVVPQEDPSIETNAGHVHQWIAPTCTEPKMCSECGKTSGGPRGHNFDSGTVTLAATCVTPGEKTYKCRNCGESYSESVGMGEHDFDDGTVITAATCAAEGVLEHKCRGCGETYPETIAKTSDHVRGEWQEIGRSGNEKTEAAYCSVCGVELDRRAVQIPGSGQTQAPSNTGGGTTAQTPSGGTTTQAPSGGTTTQTPNTGAGNNNKPSQTWVLNTNTMKFHKPSCRDVPNISTENYAESNLSKEELKAQGYSGCGHCHSG